ncbi:MAG: response regulator [Verrucomicrobiae bacterium]|nr:response regulator [Verrucomicrobiae bacterium]
MKAPPSLLIVDDMPQTLALLGEIFLEKGYSIRSANSGKDAIEAAAKETPDLVLLDITMPGMDGFEVCRRLKTLKKLKDVPVIFVSGLGETLDKVKAFGCGGVDYVTKPFEFSEVEARVDTHLRLRRLQLELEMHNDHLQELVQEQVKEITEAQMGMILALSSLASTRDQETGAHVERVGEYSRILAEELSKLPRFSSCIDFHFIEHIAHASPLHDIGKVGIPDKVLCNPGQLTPEEVEVMKNHTMIGARTLSAVLKKYPANRFLKMGIEIAGSHHERWDGSGYPQGLKEEDIPLAARILAVADQYDALRNERPYKKAFSHEQAVKILLEGDGRTLPAHFDPDVLAAFGRLASRFNEIFDKLKV